VPGTNSVAHLHENLDAASISLTEDEIHAITALVPKDD
jgi:aryl-alcohol dehydrogenase-like predicted oxidoreductase